jgi:hypothetical protein
VHAPLFPSGAWAACGAGSGVEPAGRQQRGRAQRRRRGAIGPQAARALLGRYRPLPLPLPRPRQVLVQQEARTAGGRSRVRDALLHAVPLQAARVCRRQRGAGRLPQHRGVALRAPAWPAGSAQRRGGGRAWPDPARAAPCLMPPRQAPIVSKPHSRTDLPARMASSPFAAEAGKPPSPDRAVGFAPGTTEDKPKRQMSSGRSFKLTASPRCARGGLPAGERGPAAGAPRRLPALTCARTPGDSLTDRRQCHAGHRGRGRGGQLGRRRRRRRRRRAVAARGRTRAAPAGGGARTPAAHPGPPGSRAHNPPDRCPAQRQGAVRGGHAGVRPPRAPPAGALVRAGLPAAEACAGRPSGSSVEAWRGRAAAACGEAHHPCPPFAFPRARRTQRDSASNKGEGLGFMFACFSCCSAPPKEHAATAERHVGGQGRRGG